MARVLITGANGFTGRHLIDRLARDGHELFGLARNADEVQLPQVSRAWVADLRDQSALAAVVAELRPERVVHLAAIANVAHGDLTDLYSTNIIGTRNLLQALATAPQTPEAVLITSSANVYGNRGGVLTEDLPPAPANDYGITKVACENLAAVYGDRLPIITVRPFNYTGRGQSTDFLIPKIIAHVQRRAPSIELGNTNVARDFSDVRAVVDAYARLLDSPAAIGAVLNVCSGRARTLAEVLELAEQLSGHRMEVRINPGFVRANEVSSLCGSRARLEQVIEAVPVPDLAETLGWMLNG